MDELYREYLAYLRVERGSSPLTVSAYAADLKDYALFLKKRGIESPDVIDREVIVAYESDLFDRSYAASTVDRHVSVLKGFHRFLVREGYARRNPADTIQLPKAPDRLPDVLSVAQVDEMLSKPVGSGPLALRNQTILEVLYGCGLRVSECTGLDLGDAVLEDGYLHIVGKGNKERMIFLNEACRAALDDWLEERSRQAAADPNALFLTRTHTRMTKDAVHYMVKQRLKKAGLDASLYSSHKLRHTAATLMLQNGVDVRTLQEVLGHENLNTTQIYTHVDNENLRSAAKANPLGRMKKKSIPIPPGK